MTEKGRESMSSNERSPQKPSARGTARKSSERPLSINTTQDQSIRDTKYPDEEYLLGEDDPFASNPPRSSSSAIRLNQPVARRSSRDMSTEARRTAPNPNVPPRRTQRQDFGVVPSAAQQARPMRAVTTSYEAPPTKRSPRNVHWLLYVGLGMMVALALWALGAAAINWGTNEYNTITYGYPRTFQTDAVVGHNDSAQHPSHFIAVNLHGQIIIYELPGSDPSKSIDYIGPDLIAPGEDQIPVTLSFRDVNHDGKLDMVVNISGQYIYFYNNGTKFVPNNPTP